VTVPLDQMNDAKPFNLDQAAEADEVRQKLEAAAAENLNNLKGWDDVKRMPSAVLEANHDLIQRQIKDGTKSYKFHMPYGSVPMVNRETGELKMAESYEHTKLHDTHDYLLPTEAAKEKVMQAWMAEERGKKFDHDFVQRRKNSRPDQVARANYQGAPYNSKGQNPWNGVLRSMSGDDNVGIGASSLEREVHDRFRREQVERTRRAPTFADALNEAYGLAGTLGGGYGSSDKPAWSKRALTVLWARARNEGLLDSQFEQHVPKKPIGAGANLYPVHAKYAHHAGGWAGETNYVHGVLSRIAKNSGHLDLAQAMSESYARHKPQSKEAA
jgi:hypothetical protein